MSISRRDALLGATAAAVVTGAATIPLAMKAAGVKAALAGDPVLPAYEAFEAVRRGYIAADNHIDAIRKAVDAEMPPQPHAERDFVMLSDAERIEHHAWYDQHHKRTTAILGGDEDAIINVHCDRIWDGYHDLMDIQATTVAGLLCQMRAWWAALVHMRDTEVPEPGPEDRIAEPQVLVQRLYHDIVRLAGELPS